MKVYKTANAHKEKGVEQRQHGNPIKSAGEVNLQEEGYARFNPPSRGDGAGVSVTGEVASEKERRSPLVKPLGRISNGAFTCPPCLNADHRFIISERCVGQCECPQTQWPQEKTAKTSCHGDIHPPSQRKHGRLERE